MKITNLKVNKDNPRLIKTPKFKKLVKSIKEFPEMLRLRPIVYDKANGNVVLGGNMRLEALRELGYKDVPKEWLKEVGDLTEEQKKRFIIEDNVSFGEWDWDVVIDDWDDKELVDWGVELPDDLENKKVMREIPDVGEMEFSEELLLEHNYVVLYFDNLLDWEVAKDKLGLKIVKSNANTEKSRKIGIGRVVKGSDVIKRIR